MVELRPAHSSATAKASGVADSPTLKVARRPGSFGLRFRGTITLPKDGEYTFYTDSDDGSRLLVNEKRIVDNDGIHPPQSREGKVTLKAGPHAFAVDFFDGGGGAADVVAEARPGRPQQGGEERRQIHGEQAKDAGEESHQGEPEIDEGFPAARLDERRAHREARLQSRRVR